MSAAELHERDLQRLTTEARESAAKKIRAARKRTGQTFDKEGRVVRKPLRKSGVKPSTIDVRDILQDVKKPRGLGRKLVSRVRPTRRKVV